MTSAAQIKRLLLSLGEPELRVRWLKNSLFPRLPPEPLAKLLDDLVAQSERGDPSAKESMFALVAAVLEDPEDPVWHRLREQAGAQDLLGLGRLLRSAGRPRRDSRPPDEFPVPDYGVGRELTLGERKSLARRPDRRWLDRLLVDPHPMVTELLLKNPCITETDVIRIATQRPAARESLLAIARTARWIRRERVRMALIMNPGCPHEVVIPLLFLCTRPELVSVFRSVTTARVVRATAMELLGKRPPHPISETGSPTLH